MAYFLWANFTALGDADAARLTVVAGAVLTVVLGVLAAVLPAGVPTLPLSLGYLVAGRFVAEKHQASKEAIEESPHLESQSNGTVAAMSVACLAGSIAAIAVPVLMLA